MQRSANQPKSVHPCYGDALFAQPVAGLPELDLVAHTEVLKPQPGLTIPFRDGAMNIYAGYKGAKTVSIDGRQLTLSGGELLITPPGMRHSTPALPMTKCAHYWLRVRLDLRRSFLGDRTLEPLRAGLAGSGLVHGRYAQQDLVAIRTIYDLCSSPAGSLRDLQVRMQLGLLLVQLVRRTPDREPDRRRPEIDQVTDYLERHVGEDLSVVEMADVAGMSVTALQNAFRARHGMPPGEWFVRLKMAEAQRLLLGGTAPVRQISQMLGYRSERYFSTAFRRYFLVPPGRFRHQRAHSSTVTRKPLR